MSALSNIEQKSNDYQLKNLNTTVSGQSSRRTLLGWPFFTIRHAGSYVEGIQLSALLHYQVIDKELRMNKTDLFKFLVVSFVFFVAITTTFIVSSFSSSNSSNELNVVDYSSQSTQENYFGESHHYIASGVCFCEEQGRRRRNAATLTRGVSYLLTSLTAAVAFQKAKEYFENQCVNEFEDIECSNVMSEVEEVVRVDSLTDDLQDILEKLDNSPPADENEIRIAKDKADTISKKLKKMIDDGDHKKMEQEYWEKMYHCSGNCLKKENDWEVNDDVDCESIVIDSDLPLMGFVTDNSPYFWGRSSDEKKIEIARKIFRLRVLNLKCSEKSLRELEGAPGGGGKKVSDCYGGSMDDFREGKNNIQCEKKDKPV